MPKSVNLPRWGLKHILAMKNIPVKACKFTPLGFETLGLLKVLRVSFSCKFTPLGFETA